MGYKFIIKRNTNGYRFILFPNNSNSKVIGESIPYDSEGECVEKLESFRKLVKENKINLHVKERNNVFYPSIVVDQTALFTLERGYPYHRYECDNWIQRIKSNIDAPLKVSL